MFSALFERALQIATTAHAGQTRKGSDVHYITHPVQVAFLLQCYRFDDDRILAAAVLHDVVEDTSVTLDDLRDHFPDEVIRWVAELSERKLDETGDARSWEERKQEHLHLLAVAEPEARALLWPTSCTTSNRWRWT